MKVRNFKKGEKSRELLKEKIKILRELIGKRVEISFIKKTTSLMGHLCWVAEGKLQRVEKNKIHLSSPRFEEIDIDKIYRIREF